MRPRKAPISAYYAVLCITPPKGVMLERREFCNLGSLSNEVTHLSADKGWAMDVMRGLQRRFPHSKYQLMVVGPATTELPT